MTLRWLPTNLSLASAKTLQNETAALMRSTAAHPSLQAVLGFVTDGKRRHGVLSEFVPHSLAHMLRHAISDPKVRSTLMSSKDIVGDDAEVPDLAATRPKGALWRAFDEYQQNLVEEQRVKQEACIRAMEAKAQQRQAQ